jgi:tetratricopeptide (TPR) repeat protein
MKDSITIKRNTGFVIIVPALFMLLISFAGANERSVNVRTDTQDATFSNKEYEDAGRKIVSALRSGNGEAFSSAIHKKKLLDRTFEGMSQDTDTIRKVRAGLDSALDKVGSIMTRNLGQNTRLTFIRSRSINDEKHALVRIDMKERGINYLDFILGHDESGAIKILDWHNYAKGQLYTNSLRQALVLMLPHDKTLLGRLLGTSKVNRKTVRGFSELAQLSREGKFDQWLKKYNTLPENMKYSRIMLISRVLITSAMGAEDQYRTALRDVNTYIGDDPTLSLLLIDHYFYEGDYEATHKALNRLNKYTGGDAAIDFLHANIYFTEKNYPESIKYAQLATQQDPSFEDSYWTLLNASIHEKKYQLAVNALKHLESEFGYVFDPEELSHQEGYDEFVKSSTFARWKKSH